MFREGRRAVFAQIAPQQPDVRFSKIHDNQAIQGIGELPIQVEGRQFPTLGVNWMEEGEFQYNRAL